MPPELKLQQIIRKPHKNIALLWEDHPVLVLASTILTATIIGITIYAVYNLTQGRIYNSSTYIDISSSLATILLAALTGAYVVSLKEENRKNREHREDFYNKKQIDQKRKSGLH